MDKKDVDGNLALDLAPDKEVGLTPVQMVSRKRTNRQQVTKYVQRMAEMEGVDL